MARKLRPLLPISEKDVLRFFSKCSRGEGCWEWRGTKGTFGYGIFTYRSRYYPAHRVSYFIHTGIDPLGMAVCHKCDNPQCVNPAHLWLGTKDDNRRDMFEKGREKVRGEENGNSKLTAHQVNVIRGMRIAKVPIRVIAEHLGISTSAVACVARGKSWRHVPFEAVQFGALRPNVESRLVPLHPCEYHCLMSLINKTATCWLWTGQVRQDGFSVFPVGGQYRNVRHLVFCMLTGVDPSGGRLKSVCGAAACVNPDHLRLYRPGNY